MRDETTDKSVITSSDSADETPVSPAEESDPAASDGEPDQTDIDQNGPDQNEPPPQKIPTGYKMTHRGLIFTDEDGTETTLCGQIEVLAMTRDADGNAWGLLIEWPDADGRVHRTALPRAEIGKATGNSVIGLLLDGGLDVSATRKDQGALLRFLLRSRPSERALAVHQMGWHDGKYVMPDRVIGGAADEIIMQAADRSDNDFKVRGTLDGWRNSVARLAENNHRVMGAICAALAGPLLPLVGREGGGLHFRGGSSTGKTTALRAARSVWGSPANLQSWRATSNGLEGAAACANHCCLVLDEISEIAPAEVGAVAYMLANGSGKKRADTLGNARTSKIWRLMFISSGEISLQQQAEADGRKRQARAGQEIRVLDISADAGKGLGLFDDLHGVETASKFADRIAAESMRHHGTAGPEFVSFLADDLTKHTATAKEIAQAFVRQYSMEGDSGQVARALERFALLAAAGELAIQAGILPWEKHAASRAAKVLFEAWKDGRGGRGNFEDENAIRQVAAFLEAHGNSRFQRITTEVENGQERQILEDRIIYNQAGYIREEEGEMRFLISPDIWRREVCKGMDPKQAAEALMRAGCLVPNDRRRAAAAQRWVGGKKRLYVVRPTVFEAAGE